MNCVNEIVQNIQNRHCSCSKVECVCLNIKELYSIVKIIVQINQHSYFLSASFQTVFNSTLLSPFKIII